MHDRLEPDSTLVRPELQPFVEAARTQKIAGTRVTAESVQAGLEHSRRRSQAQRMLWVSGAGAVAASVSVLALLGPLWWGDERGSPATRASEAAQIEVVQPDPAPTTATEGATSERQLAAAVRLRSTGSPEIRDAWSVALGEGTHEIELQREPGQAKTPLRIDLPGRALELIEGSATIEVVGHDAAVRLHIGVAVWIGPDGRRTQIEVEQLVGAIDEETEAVDKPDIESAASLARQADQSLAAGEREQAIATLRRLVELHPRASQTRAAVLDLARLLAATGRERQARCAYELYLDRWPNSAITAEVEAQLARLEPATCRGLVPK